MPGCEAAAPGRLALRLRVRAPLPYRVRKRLEDFQGILPAKARVGDALAVLQWLAGRELLAAFDQVRLDHRTDDALLAARDLRGDVARHVELAPVLLAGIGVRAVD